MRIKSKPGNRKFAACHGIAYKNYDTGEIIVSLWYYNGFHILYKYKTLNLMKKYFDVLEE